MKTKKAASPRKDHDNPKIIEKMPSEDVENPLKGANSEKEDKFKRKTIGYYTDDEGNIDFERTRGKSLEDIRAFINDPQVKRKFASGDSASGEELIRPELCDHLYEVIGEIFVFFGTRRGLVHETAKEVLVFSSEEKRRLRDPTARVINKYANKWLAQFQDEIALAILLSTITISKVAMLNALLALQNNDARRATRENWPLNAEVKTEVVS